VLDWRARRVSNSATATVAEVTRRGGEAHAFPPFSFYTARHPERGFLCRTWGLQLASRSRLRSRLEAAPPAAGSCY